MDITRRIGQAIGYIIYAIIQFTLTYWFIAFIVWSADVAAWHWVARLMYITFNLLGIIKIIRTDYSGTGGG